MRQRKISYDSCTVVCELFPAVHREIVVSLTTSVQRIRQMTIMCFCTYVYIVNSVNIIFLSNQYYVDCIWPFINNTAHQQHSCFKDYEILSLLFSFLEHRL